MGDPIPALHAHRVVRVKQEDIDNPTRLEALLQPLYMVAEPIIDLSGIEHLAKALAAQVEHLNRYHTSKGSERLRVVTSSHKVRTALGGAANVLRFYATLEDALASDS